LRYFTLCSQGVICSSATQCQDGRAEWNSHPGGFVHCFVFLTCMVVMGIILWSKGPTSDTHDNVCMHWVCCHMHKHGEQYHLMGVVCGNCVSYFQTKLIKKRRTHWERTIMFLLVLIDINVCLWQSNDRLYQGGTPLVINNLYLFINILSITVPMDIVYLLIEDREKLLRIKSR